MQSDEIQHKSKRQSWSRGRSLTEAEKVHSKDYRDEPAAIWMNIWIKTKTSSSLAVALFQNNLKKSFRFIKKSRLLEQKIKEQ